MTLYRFLLVITILGVVACAPSVVQRTADRGVGGTGLTDGERGLGGTGVSIADRGIGGTGIVGTITGFGSIWVNGLEVEVEDGLAIAGLDGEVSEDRLRVGHVVEVLAEAGPPEYLRAKAIALRPAVIGTVAPDMTVNGQTILSAQQLPVGSRVAVYGLVKDDGTFLASLIEPVRMTVKDVVHGRVRVDRNGNAKVGSIDVDDSFTAGMRVTIDGGSVRVTPVNPFGNRISRLSREDIETVQGSVRSVIRDYEIRAGVVDRVLRSLDKRALPGQQQVPNEGHIAPEMREKLQDRLKDFLSNQSRSAPTSDEGQSIMEEQQNEIRDDLREKLTDRIRDNISDRIRDKISDQQESSDDNEATNDEGGAAEGRNTRKENGRDRHGRRGKEGRGGRGGNGGSR